MDTTINMDKFNIVEAAGMSRDGWLELRNKSIGGSDCATILGFNPYKSAYELWGEKTGLYTPSKPMNVKMFFGNFLEDKLFELFQYWNEDFDQTIYNYNTKTKVRNAIKPTFVAYSKDNPFMHANLDGIILDKKRGEGILELKTMSGWMHDQYETGVPPYHYLQLQHYLAVTGYSWGALGILVDGSNFQIYEFERDEQVIQNIIRKEKAFWKYVTDALGHVEAGNHHLIVEPPMDGSDATQEFLKEKYSNPINEEVVTGTDEDKQNAVELVELKAKIAELTMQATERSNKLKRKIENAGVLDLGVAGKITWKANKNNVRTFKVLINN